MKQPSLNSPVFSYKSAKPPESAPSFLAFHMCVCVQSVLWLHAPMDEWLDSLSVSQTTRVRIPLNVLFSVVVLFFSLFLFFVSLLARADIRAAELATWGVGPDVYIYVM